MMESIDSINERQESDSQKEQIPTAQQIIE